MHEPSSSCLRAGLPQPADVAAEDDTEFDAVSETTLLKVHSPSQLSPPPTPHRESDWRDLPAPRQHWWNYDSPKPAGYFRLPQHEHRLSITDSASNEEEKTPSLSVQSTSNPRSCRRRIYLVLVSLGTLFSLTLATLSQLFRAPPYNLVAPQDYDSLLRTFASDQQLSPAQGKPWAKDLGSHLEQLSRHLQDREKTRGCPAFRGQTKPVPVPVSSDEVPPSAIPRTLFSSDHELPPAERMTQWRSEWGGFGFDPQFVTEDMADQFVAEHFGMFNASAASAGDAGHNSSMLSATEHAWRMLPRGVLRADFLRYILLLVRGGAWADMDVTPLAPVQEWTQPLEQWIPSPDPVIDAKARASGGSADNAMCPPLDVRPSPPEPIRLVVGIECEPWGYLLHSPRGWLESLHILPMNRHREVQFTQWVLHGGAGHPVLLDVLRRLLKANKLYSAYQIANSRGVSYEVAADGSRLAPAKDPHPWTDITAARQWAPPAPLYPPLSSEGQRAGQTEVYNGDTPRWLRWPVWPWMWLWPRLGWHELSVEEWTGPAVWTDAVVSYLYAVGGVRPRDLYGLSHPVQVADVLIAPSSWFNPYRIPLQDAKVVHNFRGSWKHGTDTLHHGPS